MSEQKGEDPLRGLQKTRKSRAGVGWRSENISAHEIATR